MNILIHHPGIIPPLKYGGAERVIYYLAKELNKKGHNVFCLVDKASSCDFATVIPFDKNKKIMQQVPKNIDIIHFHSTPQEFIPVPYVVTIHGNGSLLKLINSDIGFLSNNHKELVEAILNSDNYNRFVCHEYARDNFNSKIMAEKYLEKYELVLNGHQLNEKKPKLIQSDPKFLEWI